MVESPSPFSVNLPSFQTAWDSTSLGWLKTCPRYYQYQMLQGWSPRSKGIHLVFGGLYASGVEMYAHSRASGASHTEAQLAMVRWVLEASGRWVYHSPQGQEIEFRPTFIIGGKRCWEAVNAAGDFSELTEKDLEFIPWSPGDHKDANIKNRYTLLRSLVWNTEDRQDSPYKTVILANGKPAVELSFNFKIFDIGSESISLSGHLDSLVTNTHDGSLWVVDDKTTKGPLSAGYFQQYSPSNQMSLYSVAGKIILDQPVRGVLVRAAQIGVGFTRFATAQVPRPTAVLLEWIDETKWWIEQAHAMALANYWPQNDRSCGQYGGCPFQRVCSVSPTHRQAWLEEDFTRHYWNPLEARGDV